MGRRTFEPAIRTRGEAAFTAFTGVTSIVFSRTLKQHELPHVTVVPELNVAWVRNLKAQSGKDIWLFGASDLFRSFFDSGIVDRIEVAVIRVLLGCRNSITSPSLEPYHTAMDSPSPLPLRESVIDLRSATLSEGAQNRSRAFVPSFVNPSVYVHRLRSKRCTPVGSLGGYGSRGGSAPPSTRRTRSNTKSTSVI